MKGALGVRDGCGSWSTPSSESSDEKWGPTAETWPLLSTVVFSVRGYKMMPFVMVDTGDDTATTWGGGVFTRPMGADGCCRGGGEKLVSFV